MATRVLPKPRTPDTLDASELLAVLSAYKSGDFTARMSPDKIGLAGKVADTLNEIMERNERMASEIARVCDAVAREGRVNQRIALPLANGSWGTAVDSVNQLITDLVQPTAEMGRVIGAVAKGDLGQRMSLEVDGKPLSGEFLKTAKLVNTMAEQLNGFANEVTRVAREVGTEGKLGGQAVVKGVAGVWKDLTDSVNSMAGNLTAQVRNIAEVTTGVANGDLSRKITVDARGEILELKNTINIMVDQLNGFASEVTRVAREVGTDGKLGGQANVRGVAGVWKDLTDSVNSMARNLTSQVRNIAEVTTGVAKGDLSTKITVDAQGEILELKDTINTMVDQLNAFAGEVTRVAREVGTDGKLGGQANVKGVAGVWKDLTESVNSMAGNLTAQVRNIAQVTTGVAKGDLSTKITVDARGEILELKNTINTMVDQLNAFAGEVTRVAREVGTDGKLGGQANVKGVAGVWKDLTESVNSMAGNLTAQVRNIAQVTTGVAKGDLSTKITVDAEGEILELKNTINTMVDQLNGFASEVTRVAREVGTEGKLGGQADVKGVAGVWKDLTESVNSMAGNLTSQVRNIAEVTTGVANGDLSRKITVDARGEILELKNTINTMVDQLNAFAGEVTRVAREVGTEGKLGGQADVRGVAGVWKDLTESVNFMAGNLTAQVRNIAEVTTGVAKGDLSTKITVDAQGEILQLKNTINTMVDQLKAFAAEVTRVAREVGTDGKLGGQADVRDVAGVWKDLTESVNSMAGNLTAQVRNIAQVTTGVAKGDLSTKITVDAQGEILELKNTINTMVDQLNAFASEVTRVAREVGTEGKLGGQADVRGVAGVWRDLTESVNSMAGNLTGQVRNIAQVTTGVANGDLSRKITVDAQGEILELKNTINIMVDQLNAFAAEVTRVAREVGTEGKLGGQANVRGVAGVWKELTESVNSMARNLTNQVRNIASVTTGVAKGDLSNKITVDAQGEILELKNTINTMVDQLNGFAGEVTRVAREVGTEGKLGGQADVKGVAGVWKDLTESVNSMAANLTTQVRGIVRVVTAVANGDLKRKLVLEAKGEIAALADTINEMIDTLATFADQTTTVAREVGVEGKLGGQARVPGAAGIWSDLTNNVNQLAANLTTQVRAIGEVARAVAKGDLARSISVEAQGELAALKDSINEMILNLKDTTRKNTEQDWLKSNLAKFTRMVQGQKDLVTFSKLVLSELAPLVGAQHGVFYLNDAVNEEPLLKMFASYAYRERKGISNRFRLGEGLVGQCALEKERILINEVPNDYVKINSGLGESTPLNIVVLPVLFEGEVKAVCELASFQQFSAIHLALLDQLTESIGIALNTISATMRTEELLKESQALAEKLQTQQEELTKTNRRLEQQAATLQNSEELLRTQQEQLQKKNEELQEKAVLLAEQKSEVEEKNREVEHARRALEEKAQQLELTSRYKSEFLANMSHELRTPLNNLLILARMLSENGEGNLNEKQVKYAETIHASGQDLLTLINDILDLARIESGNMLIELTDVSFHDIHQTTERMFRHVAETKALDFGVELDSHLPASVNTDPARLQQVLKNLLANAFKFTDHGSVRLQISPATFGWTPGHKHLDAAAGVIAFSVHDTGIGIPVDKQRLIFEAFQQADGTTSRKYGGTGLGLSISREIIRLLGGEIRLKSEVGKGSTFTIYLPARTNAPASMLRSQNREVPAPSQSYATANSTLAPLAPTPSSQEIREGIRAYTQEFDDDRNALLAGDQVVMLVENDLTFGALLLEVVRSRGFKGVIATRGAHALNLARELKPSAITLDILLPDCSGFSVLERLKRDPITSHIPVHVVSIAEEKNRALALGAASFTQKSSGSHVLASVVDRVARSQQEKEHHVLVVSSDEARRREMMDIIGNGVVHSHGAANVAEAVGACAMQKFDCIVASPTLDDGSIADLIERAQVLLRDGWLRVIAYAPDSMPSDVSGRLHALADNVVVRTTHLPSELLEVVSIFLHRDESQLSEQKQKMLAHVRKNDPKLAGRRILMVDDDARNIFAITSALETANVEVIYAENGRLAIERLKDTPGIDLVLMDIMMPEMDGYAATRAIRELDQFRALPIIAVTAKAMIGDREKCIQAGASDYIPKPVDLDQLFSLLRVWLPDRKTTAAKA
jgi:HAMP domain-containing protein/signal transduction histidine kinase/DNA-binding response OmpR family regulator